MKMELTNEAQATMQTEIEQRVLELRHGLIRLYETRTRLNSQLGQNEVQINMTSAVVAELTALLPNPLAKSEQPPAP